MAAPVKGRFGDFGGQYVPETLMPALAELELTFAEAWEDEDFQCEFGRLLREFVGRPTPLTPLKRLGESLGLFIFAKREDLCHTGAHKINNAIGQCLLAQRMGKTRIIAETGAGQHGVATATACALLGLDCRVYMGSADCERQELNVFRMRLLGAEVVPVNAGTRTLKDALNEALRDWVTNVQTTHYVIGSVAGPHPFPWVVRQMQRVIGDESKVQFHEACGRLPDAVVACVGGGSNAAGILSAFVDDPAVRFVGVEAGGEGIETGQHAAPLSVGRPGVLHGSYSYLMQDGEGQVLPTHSVSAGLDYPGVGPELSAWKDSGRLQVTTATDSEAVEAFRTLASTEGLIPAFESSHAFAVLGRRNLIPEGSHVLVNLSGRGDKDMVQASKMLDLC